MVRFDYLFFFYRSQSENKDTFFGEKEKNFEKKKPTLAEGEVWNGNKRINSFCRVFPINAASYA